MAEVEIYTTHTCPYCIMAKNLLNKKKVSYREIFVDNHEERKTEAIERSGGRRTVPQIFIDDQHIGGYSELSELDKAGKLDMLLGLE